MSRLEGIVCPPITFFNRKGAVDEASFRRHLRNLVDRGLHGVFPNGTMGEFTLLTAEERRHLAEAAVDAVGDDATVFVGTGSMRTDEAVELSRHAQDIGADAVVVVTPFYLRPTPDGLRRHFNAVHRAVSIPILAYNLPSFTGYSIAPDLVADLAEEGIIQGMKDSSGDLPANLRILARVPKDFVFFTGADPLCLAVLAEGAAGGVLGTSNFFPAKIVDLYTRARKGDLADAGAIQAGVSRLSEAIGTGPFPAATKYIVDRVWGLKSSLRLPVTGLSAPERTKVDRLLKPFLDSWR